MNSVHLMGRLTADPELRHTKSDTPVASFSLAVERDYSSGEGNREADFINVVAWNKTAEFVSKFFKKGKPMLVEGRIQVRGYTDKDGQKRYATEVVANAVRFVLSDSTAQGSERKAASVPAPASKGMVEVQIDEDLPF